MKFSPVRLSLPLIMLASSPLAAQDARSIELPNPMTIHTWFIILAVGGFLAWSISYAMQLQKEAMQRKQQKTDVQRQKDQLLDRIADLETRKEAGQVTETKYKHELKELRFRLAKLLSKTADAEDPKSAKM